MSAQRNLVNSTSQSQLVPLPNKHIFKTSRHSNVEQGHAKTPVSRFSPKGADERSNNTEPIAMPDYIMKNKTRQLKELAAEIESVKAKIDQTEKINSGIQGQVDVLLAE